MNTIYTRNVYAGDVVSCEYIDLDGEKKVGLFCIIYCEKYDGNTNTGNNIVALKVTSKHQDKYEWYLPISNKRLFMNSRICCTKPYLFKFSNITGVVCKLKKLEMRDLCAKLNQYHNETIRQIMYEI